jgi:hypothetical protein
LNASHDGDPRFDTADFNDSAPGNLRADYVLPRKNLKILDSAIFWPVQADPFFRLTGVFSSANWGTGRRLPDLRSSAGLGRREVLATRIARERHRVAPLLPTI